MSSRGSMRSAVIGAIGLIAVIIAAWHAVPDNATDFTVYRQGARVLLNGGSLYTDVSVGKLHLPFTYPPFAAVLFVPFALIPAKVALAIWSLLNLAALGGISWLTAARLPTVAGIRSPRFATWELAVLIFIVANLMEPITDNFWLGQANLLVVLAILFDTVHKSRWSGLLTGVAAGFKVTPGLFIVFMLVTKRWADAARALAALAATVAVGALFGPLQEWRYWSFYLFDTTRVGTASRATNAALAGVLARISDAGWSHTVWLAAAITVTIVGLAAARIWWPKDRLVAATIVGTTTLLVSPISWIHHWVWIVPLLAVMSALTVRAFRQGDRTHKWIAGTGIFLVGAPSLLHARRFFYPMQALPTTARELAAASYSIGALAGIIALILLAGSYSPSKSDAHAID